MSVASIAAKPAVVVPKGSGETKGSALPGVMTGAVVTAGLTTLGMAKGSLPLPIALALGGVVGGPIMGVSLMNNDGKPNKLWQSALVGAGPAAVIGGALGWLGAGLSGMGPKPISMAAGIITGALVLGGVGAGIGALTHAATKPD